MATNHAAVAALPISGSASKTLLRNLVTGRMPYVLADADVPTDLVAVDPSTGAAIVDIIYLGRLFHYDATDTVTANDGVTCLVSFEGRRYKISDGDVFAFSVLENSLSAPPALPSIGDAYLIAAGATGAWAGKSNYIGAYTRRGWEFMNYGIGRFVYVESIDTYYHRNTGGTWVAGFGNQAFGANSIPLSAAINFGKRVIVENQTTNAPPGSPGIGDTYIIGSSPTGSWAGHALDVAVCENGSTFTIYDPTNGWEAYDKSLNHAVTFTGSAWVSTVGAWVNFAPIVTTVGSGSVAGNGAGTVYVFSATPPDTTKRLVIDQVPLIYVAAHAGARLRIRYRATVTLTLSGSAGNLSLTAALFRDAVSNAIAWQHISVISAGNTTWVIDRTFEFNISAVDASSHTYAFAVMSGTLVGGTGQCDANLISDREWTLEEAAT